MKDNMTYCELQTEMTRIGFCMDDLRLFLDTHPDCSEALAQYNAYAQEYHELHHMYVKQYGPYQYYDRNSGNQWEWVDRPWPWEGGF